MSSKLKYKFFPKPPFKAPKRGGPSVDALEWVIHRLMETAESAEGHNRDVFGAGDRKILEDMVDRLSDVIDDMLTINDTIGSLTIAYEDFDRVRELISGK